MSRTLSRREFLSIAGTGSALTLLAACAPKPTEAPGAPTQPPAAEQPTEAPAPTEKPAEPTPAPAVTKQKVTFTMYGHPGMIEEMVPIFNETHPDVEVVFERSEGQGYWEKLTAAVAAGQAWDCFRGDPNRALGWGPKGVVVDVRPFMETDTTYPMDGYLPGIVECYAVEDKIYGLPTWCLTMWLFYNKKIFDEAGLDYPTPETTWEEYVQMAKALTKTDADGNIVQFGSNGWEWWTFPVAQAVWSNGGCFYYNDDLTGVCVNDPKTVEALQEIADLIWVHKVAPSPLTPPGSPVGLLSDNVAMEANGDYLPWDQRDIYLPKYEYLDAVMCPLWNGNRRNIYWPDCFLINAKSAPEVQAAAYKWESWFACDPASIGIQCKVVFPVVKNAYEDPEIAKTWLVSPRPPGMIEQALEHTKALKYWKVELHISDLDNIYYGEIGRLWNNEATAEEVCATMQQLMEEVMAQPVEVEI